MTKRFIVESVMIDCLCKDEPRIAKVITDTDENYSYEDLYEVAELLNGQQATINKLKSDIEETEISIKLFEDDVNRLSKENEQLKSRIAIFEEQEDEFEKYTAQTIQNMIANYRDDW